MRLAMLAVAAGVLMAGCGGRVDPEQGVLPSASEAFVFGASGEPAILEPAEGKAFGGYPKDLPLDVGTRVLVLSDADYAGFPKRKVIVKVSDGELKGLSGAVSRDHLRPSR